METVNAVALHDADIAKLPTKEQVLLKYVRVLTREPWKVDDALTEELRKAGWSDEEIFEASFITSLFAFFNRMAESYGLGFGSPWRPPEGIKWEADPSAAPPAPKPEVKPAPPAKPTPKPAAKKPAPPVRKKRS